MHSIIYISLGTLLNTPAAFFRKCIDAFRDEPVSVIISIGKSVKKEQLGEIPDNIFIYPFNKNHKQRAGTLQLQRWFYRNYATYRKKHERLISA